MKKILIHVSDEEKNVYKVISVMPDKSPPSEHTLKYCCAANFQRH